MTTRTFRRDAGAGGCAGIGSLAAAGDLAAAVLLPQLPPELRREVFSYLSAGDLTALSGAGSELRDAVVEGCWSRIAALPRQAWIDGSWQHISKLEKPPFAGWPVWCRSLCEEICVHCGAGRRATLRVYSPWCPDADGLTPPAPVCGECWNRYPYYRMSWDDALRCFYLDKRDIWQLAREKYAHVGEIPLVYFERDIAEVASRKYAGRKPAPASRAEKAMNNRARHKALRAALVACGITEPQDLSIDPFVYGTSNFRMKDAVQFYVRWDAECKAVRARCRAVKEALASNGVLALADPRCDSYVFWGPEFCTLADSARSHVLRHLLNWHTHAGERAGGAAAAAQGGAVPCREVQANALYHLYESQLARTPAELERSRKCLTCSNPNLLDVQPRVEVLQACPCACGDPDFEYPLVLDIRAELYPEEYRAAWEAELESRNAVSRRRWDVDGRMVRVLKLQSERRREVRRHAAYRRYIETGVGLANLERLLRRMAKLA